MAKDFTEKDLLKGLARNDKRSVEILYKENYNMVQSLVINNNGTADDARDVFQEAMIVLYENAKSDHFELNCLIKTYLYSVARRLWLKKLSHAKKYVGELKDDQEIIVPVEEEIEAHALHDNQFALMEKALSGLGEPCKSLLEAYYMRKKSMTDIAEKFGYTNADNAKNQKYKCLMRLKKIFFSEYKNELL
ncbi:MAG: sigma-70 family RNA polymerase sigma factor [Williamsia sp.]|nr:sigma-70 family RNA polymerase sigma factor [Williamsia sp.]